MNFRFTVLETSLNRAEFRWKWLRFVQYSSVLGIILSLLLLLFGASILFGWLTSKDLAVTLLVALGAVGFIVWLVTIISIMANTLDRHWLGAAVERVDRRFLDRLNTLLFLEKRGEPRIEAFATRIARQAQHLVAQKKSPSPFQAGTSLAWFAAFLFVAGWVLWLNHSFAPWQHLLALQKPKPVPEKSDDKPLELALPATNNVEQNKIWGEVRITDPGVDLKVTKVDVVPLQIEAAASRPLSEVQWSSAVNGENEAVHPLPPPSEPRYAVYQPTIYLDELNLSDWDVMTYYAQASTDPKASYASEVYFLEVRPFREDILKMPGGEGGAAYQTLSGLSSLINRQQHIIRQTHQHVQRPHEQESMQAQDRKKLADAEHDLSGSAQHLYAQTAATMENKPIGDALDNLAKAQKSLEGASQSLQSDAMPEAQNRERGALSELIAARKMFQKAISDNPGAFDDQQNGDEESSPVADSSKKLNQMAEFRNEAKAARDFVQKMVEQQRAVDQRSRGTPSSQYPRLGQEEQQLRNGLRDFQEQHPQIFKGSEAASSQAQQSLGQAADALQNRDNNARAAIQQATRELEKFNDALQNQSMGQQLADAYKLKQMLDQQIQSLDQRSKPDSKMPDSELQKTTREAQQTVDQLKKSAEQEPTRDAFGQPLRDALSGQNKVDLDSRLQKLQGAQEEQDKQEAAGEARNALGKVSKAFDASQPQSMQMARQNDALKQGDQNGFAQGMAELDSLIKQLENNRQLSDQDLAKQGQQALANLQNGMRSQFGDNDNGNQLLLKLQQALKTENSPDIGDLKKLMDALQHFSLETSEQLAKQDQPDVSNIDPAHLPAAYRGRIQKYFQKLSEK